MVRSNWSCTLCRVFTVRSSKTGSWTVGCAGEESRCPWQVPLRASRQLEDLRLLMPGTGR